MNRAAMRVVAVRRYSAGMQTSQSRLQEISRERAEAIIDAHIPARQSSRKSRIAVPASFFGIVLGLAGLGGAWRVAARVWQLPAVIGEGLMLIAGIVWAVMLALYAAKWIYARDEALRELEHPVQCCFVGLIGVATMLVSIAVLPYSRPAAQIAFAIGVCFTLGFALWRTGILWHGGRDPGDTTPVLYLPAVAGAFVTATAAAALGYRDWGQLAFGAGLFSWFAIESVLLHRLYTATTMPAPLRPTLGIQLAPPVVGGVAYLSVTTGAPDLFAYALLGYGVLQALLLLRLLPWIRQQPFAPSYWAFTFGASALAAVPLDMMERGTTGAIASIAPYLFVASNIVIALIALGTLRLMLQGRLLPKTAA
jgi:tellurite resistance protein